ncbi:MAG: YbdD/YjiX family protein [Propionibacteriaceae bacterium]|nr:YbdD/YjiX family protein [Propionibacteriaceae bacterium]
MDPSVPDTARPVPVAPGGGAGRAPSLPARTRSFPTWASSLLARAWSSVRSIAATVRWYTRELMGDAAYDHYLARWAVEHPTEGSGAHHDGASDGHAPMSRREFWRHRIDSTPVEGRCC